MSGLVAWAVTTGEAGMRTQARGLAEAVADAVIEKTVGLRAPWSWLPGALAPNPLLGLKPDSAPLSPPWPDLMITCGRRSTALSIAVRKASQGKVLTVHVQDPRTMASAFDLIVAMDHDPIPAGPNVIKVSTALHDLTPEKLETAKAFWAPRFKALGRPLVGVTLGGHTAKYPFASAQAARLGGYLKRLRDAGCALAITPSRRTPMEVRDLLAATFRDDPGVFLWDMEGENPYRGILACSDRLVATSDSVSMVSECISAPHPVEVFDLGAKRHSGFLQNLLDRNLVRIFEGDPEPPVTSGPVDATAEAAAAVKRLISARRG